MGGRGVFVGIGVGHYTHDDQEALPGVLDDVRRVHDRLAQEFDGEPLLDATETEVLAYLRGLPAVAGGGPLVLLWSGHASGEVGLRLLAADSGGDVGDGVDITEVALKCARTGAGHVLLILDTCYAGAGVPDAIDRVVRTLAARPPEAEARRVWVGVLAAARPLERARDGELGAVLGRLLSDGPVDADLQRRWSSHNRLVTGYDLCDAVLKEWRSADHEPVLRTDGNAWFMLPNPLWKVDAPAVVVEHLLLAARSGPVGEVRSWFSGRQREVDTVVGWVSAGALGATGVRVVTGSAGTGKSAITGRVVSVSNPEERTRLLQQGDLGHADPGAGSVAAHAHARGRTADQVAELLDTQLTAGAAGGVAPDGAAQPDVVGVLSRHEGGPRNAALLVGDLQRNAERGGFPPVVVVVDGLDEARGTAFSIATDLLVPLSRYATVIVSTRDVPKPDSAAGETLLGMLNSSEVLDLDAPSSRTSSAQAIQEYVFARLSAGESPNGQSDGGDGPASDGPGLR